MTKTLTFALALALCGGALAAGSKSPKEQAWEAVALADGMKTAVAHFAAKSGRLPTSNEEAGLPAPTVIHGRYASSGTVSGDRITFEFGPGADASLVARHLIFDASLKGEGERAEVTWTCRSEDIAQDACPNDCSCDG